MQKHRIFAAALIAVAALFGPSAPALAAPPASHDHPASISRRINCPGSGGVVIVTKNGNPSYMGFGSDSLGYYIITVGGASARCFYYFQTSSSCPGVSNCSEGHWLTNQELRMVVTNCNDPAQAYLSTNTDQTGDTWFYWTDSNGNHYIISRHCAMGFVDKNYAMASDEVYPHRWKLTDASGWYNKILLSAG